MATVPRFDFLKTVFLRPKLSYAERYHVEVVAPDPAELDLDLLPIEIRFAVELHPEWKDKLQALFERGYAIGIRTIRRCPPFLLEAVERIAGASQEGTMEPWLSRLVHDTEIPVFTEEELRQHYELGMNLFDEAHLILEYRHRMKQFLLVDLEHHGIEESDRTFVSEMDRTLRPVSETYLLHRIHADRVPRGFHLWKTLANTLLIIAPVAHVLERWVRGMGQLFAVLADDVIHGSAELISLRQSGYTSKQLWKHGQLLLPVLVVAVFVALQVESVRASSPFFGGFLFGLAAALFPFADRLRRFAELRSGYAALEHAGKYPTEQRPSLSVLASRELVRNSSMRGSLIGLVLLPFIAGASFLLFPSWTQNGWFLAVVASTDFFVVLLVRAISTRLERRVYEHRVLELMKV